MKPFKKGFVQKCAEYGIDKEVAKELFNKIANTPTDWIDNINQKGSTLPAGAGTAPAPAPAAPAAPKPTPQPIRYSGIVNTPVQNPHFNQNATYTPSKPMRISRILRFTLDFPIG
jgi:hypothetical protein